MEAQSGLRWADEPDRWEPGAIRDLLKDAKGKYAGIAKLELRAAIDHDTAYLGIMDLDQLAMPAKEAGVAITKDMDAEKVRSLIRDVIEKAAT